MLLYVAPICCPSCFYSKNDFFITCIKKNPCVMHAYISFIMIYKRMIIVKPRKEYIDNVSNLMQVFVFSLDSLYEFSK